MIISEQDVLDSKAHICGGDLPSAWRGLNDERCLRWRKSFGLRNPIQALDSHQHISGSCRQTLDCNGMSIEPAVPPDRAALEKSSAVERGTRRCHVLSAFRQLDVDCEPRLLTQRGNFP